MVVGYWPELLKKKRLLNCSSLKLLYEEKYAFFKNVMIHKQENSLYVYMYI